MPILHDSSKTVYELSPYTREDEFERDIVTHADQIFGVSALYIDVKKKISGNNIVSIPDGYVIDLTDPQDPELFVVENEIASHDPFRHIGIQMLRFVTSFDGTKQSIRAVLMEQIAMDNEKLRKLELAAKQAGSRNVDAYLDKAVFRGFQGIVIIDDAQDELHHVLKSISGTISVIEFKRYRAADGSSLFQYGTLYDELYGVDEADAAVTGAPRASPELRAQRRARRARSDTVVVPAREEGFNEVFLGERKWRSIKIGAAMLGRIKYIAAYQIAPTSAVTYIAEVSEIRPYKNTGKYELIFRGPAEKIKPIPVKESKNAPQGPMYVRKEDLLKSKYLEDALTNN